jgi:transposase
MLHRVRENRVKQRTALVNQVRGLLGEYGIVVATGVERLRQGLCELLGREDKRLSAIAREQFYALYEELLHQSDRIAQSDRAIKAVFNQCGASQRLASLPGIGVITATALVACIGDVKQFKNGRELSAYLGLVPRQHSSGGKTVLSGISKRGNTYLRTLLIHGARSILRHLKGKEDRHSVWLAAVSDRRGHNKACVAQANKTARRVWALLSQETVYRLTA